MPLSDFNSQNQSVGLLQRSLSLGRLGHAYLFTGEKISFLNEFAHALAATMLCPENGIEAVRDGRNADCCGQCKACLSVFAGTHPDFHILRPESKLRQIRMEPTQNLIKKLQSKSFYGGYKIGLISGIDRMNDQASNAFLKTLEEPTPKTLFLLLTTEPDRLLDTISSRCLKLHFPGSGKIDFPDLIKNSVVDFAGTLAGGNQKIPETLWKYKLIGSVVQTLAELTNSVKEEIDQRISNTAAQSEDLKARENFEAELKAMIEAEYRLQRSQLFLSFEWFFRDIWLIQNELSQLSLAYPDLSEFSTKLASKLTSEESHKNILTIESLQKQLHTNVQESLAIEVCFLSLHLGDYGRV